MSLSSHQSAKMKNDEWLTPPEIIKACGTFDLDPCAPIVRPWDTAAKHYTIEDDGLAQPWAGRVWCNPPFGREAVKWLRKMVDHGNGIALIPARTETAMFYETVWGHADAVLFMQGRPHFHYVCGRRAAANSGAPICLVAYGSANAAVLMSSKLGIVLPIIRGCNVTRSTTDVEQHRPGFEAAIRAINPDALERWSGGQYKHAGTEGRWRGWVMAHDALTGVAADQGRA